MSDTTRREFISGTTTLAGLATVATVAGVPGVALGAAADAAVGETAAPFTGTISSWPIRNTVLLRKRFAAANSCQVMPKRCAMTDNVSPERTL